MLRGARSKCYLRADVIGDRLLEHPSEFVEQYELVGVSHCAVCPALFSRNGNSVNSVTSC